MKGLRLDVDLRRLVVEASWSTVAVCLLVAVVVVVAAAAVELVQSIDYCSEGLECNC